MKRVGIITYHSAYNFGSVLQALATQIAIDELGYDTKIINYRMKSQRDFYSFFRKNYGYKTFVKDLMLVPYNKQRKLHNDRFEKVISRMDLTEEYVEPQEVESCVDQFDCFVSGSDQIWNKRSCELTPVGWEYMDPYLLSFTDKKKISYASSIASMTDEEIDRILPQIKRFDTLSFRERISAVKVSEKTGKPVETVLDPTLLLNKKQWAKQFDLKDEGDKETFILYYSLAGYQDVKDYLSQITSLAKQINCKVIAITPFLAFKNTDVVKHVYDAGPIEFLKYVWNAKLIVTDSYHGTLFSINFQKPFYSVTNGSASHMRKNQILEMLDLENRICIDPCNLKNTPMMDYSLTNEKVNALRAKSLTYLEKALSN